MKRVKISRSMTFSIIVLCLVSSFACKRTFDEKVVEPKNESALSVDHSTVQEPISDHDSADLINYVVSFSNLFNRDNFKDYYASIRGDVPRFVLDSNEIDTTFRNGIADLMNADESYQEDLAEYTAEYDRLDSIYNISEFTRSDWETVMRSAHKAEIYLFPDAKKKVFEDDDNAKAAAFGNGTCSDAYRDQEVLIGGIMFSGAFTCRSMGVNLAALFCWAALGASYAYLEYDLNNNFWCRCMIEQYNTCVY